LTRPNSFTCCCKWAVDLRSVLRHSSNRPAKWELFELSKIASIDLTQSMASWWKALRHKSMVLMAEDKKTSADGVVHLVDTSLL